VATPSGKPAVMKCQISEVKMSFFEESEKDLWCLSKG
jgi:hypothetical protein